MRVSVMLIKWNVMMKKLLLALEKRKIVLNIKSIPSFEKV